MSFALEKEVLGGLMWFDGAWDEFGHELQLEDLQHGLTRSVFRAMRRAADRGRSPDLFEVIEAMEQDSGAVDETAVRDMAETSTSRTQLPAKIALLKDSSVSARVKETARQILTLTGSGADVHAEAMALLGEITLPGDGDSAAYADVSRAWLEEFERLRERGGDSVGLTTQFPDTDRRLGGLRGSELTILAGRPAMGKTGFAMAIVEHVARGNPVQVYSLEMGREQLVERTAASISGVPLGDIRNPGRMSPENARSVRAALAEAAKQSVWVDDTPSLTIEQIKTRARRAHRTHGIRLVVVDYLQLVGSSRRYEQRRTEVAEVSRGLKHIAKELDIPVIALSQLNRKCEERPDKRPMMADLAESGAVEQDADNIGFLYRDEVYNESSPRKGVCELIWRKVRNGAPGTDFMWFEGARMRFRPALRDEVPEAGGAIQRIGRPYAKNPVEVPQPEVKF